MEIKTTNILFKRLVVSFKRHFMSFKRYTLYDRLEVKTRKPEWKLKPQGEDLYKRSAFVLIPFVLYTILYVCMLQFTK